MSDNTNGTNSAWIPDEILDKVNRDAQERLDGRKAMNLSRTDTELVKAQFAEAAPLAAASIIHLATHSTNERTRLSAAQYVVERAIGRPGEDGTQGGKDVIMEFLEDVMNTSASANKNTYNSDEGEI
jgi:hypothetical protein